MNKGNSLKAVVLAYSQIGCEGIKALLDNGIEVAAVFTHTDNPQENIWFESVAELASSRGIPVFAPEDINSSLWVKKIREFEPDAIFSFYYRQIISSQILNIPPLGCLNLHGSLLPRYRGRCPINWALINGEDLSGVTLHYMTFEADSGDIVGQQSFTIEPEDTADSLNKKAVLATRELLNKALPDIKKDKVKRISQDHSIATCFKGRRPEDGTIDWGKSSREVTNLVRAVTHPYPGAFSYIGNQKCFFWKVKEVKGVAGGRPGVILSVAPLTISCGEGAVEVVSAQMDGGIVLNGAQFAEESGLTVHMTIGKNRKELKVASPRTKVLILGINGFIGNHLSERLLESGRYEVYGMDLQADSIRRLMDYPHFHFIEGDISIHREWIEYHIRKCDIVLPLVAIATPIEYVRNPLKVFELDFEENLRITRYCVKYNKRIIFPSTSEVYGMCEDPEFDEESSQLVLGPIRMQRWIYSCSKQLLDRVIWAYGTHQNLHFTLFRPFNWIGPRLDSLDAARIGSSRVITQFILNLVEGTSIKLVDGGRQKRCFTSIKDGVECLFKIIEDKYHNCDGKIINIGHPDNNIDIKGLAELLIRLFEKHPLRDQFPPTAPVKNVESSAYYGSGYEDVSFRKPSIKNAKRLLKWSPEVDLQTSIAQTLDFFLQETATSSGVKPSKKIIETPG